MKKILINTYITLSSFEILRKLRRSVSPVFLAMLLAASVLWYISKLSYNYTTELDMIVEIESERIEARCVVEGVGTNLFGYKIGRKSRVKIPISELRFETNSADDALILNSNSLSGAISIRYSDIKIISIDADLEIQLTPDLREAINKASRHR